MNLHDSDDDQISHEEILEAVVARLLTEADLEQLCDETETVAIYDEHRRPVYIRSADTYRDASALSIDRGVMVELSDGSCFGLTVIVYNRPAISTRLQPVEAPEESAPSEGSL